MGGACGHARARPVRSRREDLPWDYLECLASALEGPMVFVPGNHDRRSCRRPRAPHRQPARRRLACDPPGRRLAQRRRAVSRPAGFGSRDSAGACGTGGARTSTASGSSPLAAATAPDRAPAGRSARELTHTPPRGLGDAEDRARTSGRGAAPRARTAGAAWHLHGHIHPYGQSRPDRQVGDDDDPQRDPVPHVRDRAAPWELAMSGDTGSPRADAEADSCAPAACR